MTSSSITTNKFGLTDNAYIKISNLLKHFNEFEKVILFGSRALSSYKEGSDIDLAVFGTGISKNILRKFRMDYENLNLPYQIDLIHYESIENLELKKHIDDHGVLF